MKRTIFALVITLAMAFSLNAANVKVEWDANTETDLAGYRVYMGLASGVYGQPVDVGNVTEHTVTLNPEVGTEYFFAVTAYDTSNNESGFSDEVSIFVPDQTAPEKPKSLIVRIIEAIMAWLKELVNYQPRTV